MPNLRAMIYRRNLPVAERYLRVLGGAAFVVVWVLLDRPLLGTLLGAALIITGFWGFCPACALAGRRLRRSAPEGD